MLSKANITKPFLETIYNEKEIVGCYVLHEMGKKVKKVVPKFEKFLKKGNLSHYNKYGLKTKLTAKGLRRLFV